jgi:murein DD-endopeptidase MepM/ murein hydrolase activator NlpD
MSSSFPFHGVFWSIAYIWIGVCIQLPRSAIADAHPKFPETENRQFSRLSELGVRNSADHKGDGIGIEASREGAILRAGLQGLAGSVTAQGLWLESTSDQPGRLQLVARSMGRDEPLLAIDGPGSVSVSEKVVTFNRPGLTEEYSVSEYGVRQDFVVCTKPAGSGPLRVELAVTGATAEASAGGARLILTGSQRILAYNRLQVVDATGRTLTSRMEVPASDRLTLVVEDNAATYPIRIDPTFSDSNWSNGFANNGPNGDVYALAVSGTDLYVGGSFTSVGGVPATNIAKWNGTAWSSLGKGMSVFDSNRQRSRIQALTVNGTDLYVGGSFTSVGGVPAANIAKWNGRAWSALGEGVNGQVSTLAVSGTNLYAGGAFSRAGGLPVPRFAKWNGSSWSVVGRLGLKIGEWSNVTALDVNGNDLYVAINIPKQNQDDQTFYPYYVFMFNGSAWSRLGGDEGMNDSINCLAVSGKDVYAGGSFTKVNGSSARSIAKWSGRSWLPLGHGLGGHIRALAVNGTDLYAGGYFSVAGGGSGIAKWNGDTWSSLGSRMDGVFALAISGKNLYVGGNFTEAGLTPSSRIAQTVVPSSQSITFGSLTDKTFGDAPFALTATASSGLPPSFSVVSGPATIEGKTLTLTGGGVVIVRASQAGDATYSAAASVDRIFTVRKLDQSIAFSPLMDQIISEPSFTLTATASSSLPIVFSIVSGPATLLRGSTLILYGTGTIVVRASQGGNHAYLAAASVDRSFTVRSIKQSVFFNPLADRTIGDPPFTLNAIASSGLPIVFSIVSGSASLSRNSLTMTGFGTIVIRASQPGNATYAPAVPVDRSFTVRKIHQSIDFEPLVDKTLKDSPFALTATASSGLPIVFSKVIGPATIVGSTITLTGAGTVVVRASQAGNDSYSAATPVERTFTVGSLLNQELPVELGVRSAQGNSALELVVPKSDSAGVIELFGAGTLESLASQPSTIQFTNAPTGGDLLWRVPVEKQAFYRALLRAGKTLEDYSIPDWDEPVDPTNRVALVVAGVPEELVSGSLFTATLVLTRSDLQIVPLAATGRLRVLSWQNGGLHPDATVEPSGVRFTNGIAVVRTTIQAITSLEGFTVGIEWADAAPVWPGPASRRGGTPAKGSILQLPNTPLRCLSEPDLTGDPILLRRRFQDCILSFRDTISSWTNPLPQAPAGGARAVVGSFGEWRGHKRLDVTNDNVHMGLDLKANKGEEVRASRGGWLTKHDGIADGRYVTINHLDGTYSRYLHLKPWASGDAKPGRVKRGDRLGSVGNPGGGPHLHFEIRRTPDIFSSAGQPGQGVDPVREAGLFPLGGLDNPTILESFQVAGEHPANGFVPYAGATAGSPADGGQAYVIIQVRQKRSDDRGHGLSPRGVQMRWEGGGGPVGLDLADGTAVTHAKPANAKGRQAGFAIYKHGNTDAMVVDTPYRYWFRWDASRYASEPNGARTLTLTAMSYAPKSMTNEWQVKWGPEIEAVEPVGEVGADGWREYRVRVRYWRGHRVGGEAEPVQKGHDWYEYELSQGGVWLASGGIEGVGTKFTDRPGTNTTRELRFRMPTGNIASGWVKVSSGRVPSIAHRMEFDLAGCLDLTKSYESACVGWWSVRLEYSQTSNYRLKVNADGTGLYFAGDSSWPTKWWIRKEGCHYKFFEHGFWHPVFDDDEREALTLPIQGFKTSQGQIYIKE